MNKLEKDIQFDLGALAQYRHAGEPVYGFWFFAVRAICSALMNIATAIREGQKTT